jgi:hypothetical protein
VPFFFLAGFACAQQPSAAHLPTFPKVMIAGSQVRMIKSTSTGRDNDLYNYRADPSRRLLQGSSYTGLFTLYALFADPGLFSGYVGASPAVPFGDRYAFKQEAEYARTHKELPVKLFLAVGGSEGLAPPVQEFMRTLQSRGYKG